MFKHDTDALNPGSHRAVDWGTIDLPRARGKAEESLKAQRQLSLNQNLKLNEVHSSSEEVACTENIQCALETKARGLLQGSPHHSNTLTELKRMWRYITLATCQSVFSTLPVWWATPCGVTLLAAEGFPNYGAGSWYKLRASRWPCLCDGNELPVCSKSHRHWRNFSFSQLTTYFLWWEIILSLKLALNL